MGVILAASSVVVYMDLSKQSVKGPSRFYLVLEDVLIRFLLVILTLSLSTLVAATPPKEGVIRKKGAEIRLGFDQSEIPTGGILRLRLEVHNTGGRAAKGFFVSRFYLPEGNDIRLEVTAPGELPYRFTGGQETAIFPAAELDVAPGKKKVFQMPIIYDEKAKGGYVFSKPGQYLLRARLDFSLSGENEQFAVETPATIVNVKPAAGEQETVLKLFASAEYARALQLMYAPAENLLNSLKEVGMKHPNTPLGRQALFAVATQLASSSPPQFEESNRVWRKLYEVDPQGDNADFVIYNIAQNYARIGNRELSRDWFFLLLDSFPETVYTGKDDKIYKFFWGDPVEASVDRPWYLSVKPWYGKPAELKGEAAK